MRKRLARFAQGFPSNSGRSLRITAFAPWRVPQLEGLVDCGYLALGLFEAEVFRRLTSLH